MKATFKRWAVLGLGTALGTGLVACGSSEEGATPAADRQAVETPGAAPEPGSHMRMGEMGEGEAGHDMETLSLPERLAFMTGHVEAGLALYRAGEPQMAAPHLLHPVSETHRAERAGLAELGFDASLFEAVSKALEEGRPAAEIEPQLAAAEANLAMVAEQAGGDPSVVIRFLMETIVAEYSIAITDDAVSDPGEYQDAYGFAVVARDRAAAFDPPAPRLLAEIDNLIALWPEAPVPPADPTPVGQVIAQTSKVLLAMP